MPIIATGSGGITCANGMRATAGLKLRGVVSLPLAFVSQPQSKTVDEYALATFSCEVTGGVAPYSYQWKKNAANVGTNSAALSFTAAATDKNASITVTVTDSAGSVITSNAAVLSVMRNVVTFNGTTQRATVPTIELVANDVVTILLARPSGLLSDGYILSAPTSVSTALYFNTSASIGSVGNFTYKIDGVPTNAVRTDGVAQQIELTMTGVGQIGHIGSRIGSSRFVSAKIYHLKVVRAGITIYDYRMNDGFANNPVCVNSGTTGASGNGTYIGLTSGSWTREVAS